MQLIILALLFNVPPMIQAGGLKAYIYYEDATCVNKSTISGTLVFAYNDKSYVDQGFTKNNFKGPCKYFDGGHYDLVYNNKSSSKGSFMNSGYCIKCGGVTGCTKTKNDCSDFQNALPEYPYYSQNGYQQQSPNFYGMAVSTTSSASKIESMIYKEVSNVSDTSFSMYMFIGVLMGMISLFLLALTGKSIQRIIFSRIQVNVDVNELLDDFNDQKIKASTVVVV